MTASTEIGDARSILIVDDEESVRAALRKAFEVAGYRAEAVATGEAALAQLAGGDFDVMLCDVRMPGLSGLELLPHALRADPDLAVVMISGVNDAPTATEALTKGATDYVIKPFDLDALRQAVERALHKRRLRIEQRRVERLVRQEVAVRTTELEHERLALRALTVNIAETLINAMEAKDVYLRGHSQRVADLGASIAEELALDADTVERVRLAGRLHDVGKIGVRESVLNKPDKLTPEEFDHVKAHVVIGMTILSPLQHLGETLRYVHDHHEHWDGTGYPRGLRGDAISIGGRILAAADSYDALTSRRAYRSALSTEETLALLAEGAGSRLEPEVYAAMRAVVERQQSLVFIDDRHA